MRKIFIYIISMTILLFPEFVNANIVCNDGSLSATCTTCHQGCCSHHGGCSSASTNESINSTNNIDNNNGTIICNDGTISKTCTTCHQGCCSRHGGCSSQSTETNKSNKESNVVSETPEKEEKMK